jgi:hypothetical protein
MSKQRTKKTRSSFRRAQQHKKAQSLIERVWAEDGMVFSVTKDGQSKIQTVKEAATSCMAINAHMTYIQNLMKDPSKDNQVLREELRKGNDFIKLVSNVCRQAQAQKEAGNKKTDLLQNFVNHKDINGKDNALTDEDQRVEFLSMQLHTLDEQEIRAVLRNKSLPHAAQEQVLTRMHTQNLAEQQNFGKSDIIL